MKTRTFLHLLAIFTTAIGIPAKAQQVITSENSNASIPLDPFLDDEEFEKDYPFIVCLKYHLSEEMLPKLLTEIAMQNIPCATQDCSVSLIDIAEATQLSRFSTEVLAEAIGKLNITSTNVYTIPSLYKINSVFIEDFLQTFNFTFSEIYNKFRASLSNPSQALPDILTTLNVSVADFVNAQVFGNDTLLLKVLSTGNYSEANVNAVLNITNKTSIDMLKLIPLTEIAKQINKLDAVAFAKFVENLGVTSDNLVEFYQFLNITPINFLSYPAFINIVSDFYALLNPEEILGTIVSPSKLVTSNTAKALATFEGQNTDLVRYYANFHAELVENPFVQYYVKNVTLTNAEYEAKDIAYVEIKNPNITAFAEVSKDYNKTALFNCTYVSKLLFGGVYSENLNLSQIRLENNTIIVTKTNNTLYNLGSPLFCQDKLYGIATEENVTHIKFSTFLKKIPVTIPTTTTAGQQPAVSENFVTRDPNVVTVSEPGSSTALSCSLFSIVLTLAVLKLSV